MPVPSKGAALLGKMGWTAGEGLGAQGTGRTDVIVTELYTQGVGLVLREVRLAMQLKKRLGRRKEAMRIS